eukprot:s1299_g16.t1
MNCLIQNGHGRFKHQRTPLVTLNGSRILKTGTQRKGTCVSFEEPLEHVAFLPAPLLQPPPAKTPQSPGKSSWQSAVSSPANLLFPARASAWRRRPFSETFWTAGHPESLAASRCRRRREQRLIAYVWLGWVGGMDG